MRLFFTFELDMGSENYKNHLIEVTTALEDYLKSKSYGVGITTIGIYLISIGELPGYEKFNKLRRPQYKQNYIVNNPIEGDINYGNYYYFDLKFKEHVFQKLLIADGKVVCKLIAGEIIDALFHFDKLPKKVINFDATQFKLDVTEFLRSKFI